MINHTKMKKLDIFIQRLKKIGIDIGLSINYPWVYLDYINKIEVTEKFFANHGFTVAFFPIRKNQKFEFTDTKEIFKLIRKYIQ